MEYNKNNIFARILRKELPADIVYEDDYVLAFHDVSPKAPVHILVIPKREYVSFFDFSGYASPEEMVALNKAIYHIVQSFDLQKKGFRILSNCGADGGQEVPHFHVHIFGGHALGPMITPKK